MTPTRQGIRPIDAAFMQSLSVHGTQPDGGRHGMW
jgi:hypothetical protein